MKIWDLITTANSNLIQSKLRTFLTIGAVFVGAMVLTLSLGLGKGSQEYIDFQLKGIKYENLIQISPDYGSSFSDVFPQEPKQYKEGKEEISINFFKPLDQEDYSKIEKIEGINSIIPEYAIDQEYIEIDGNKYSAPLAFVFNGVSIPLVAGKLDDLNDDSIVIGYGYLKAIGAENPEDVLGKSVIVNVVDIDGDSKNFEFKISGVAASSILINVNSFITEGAANNIIKFRDNSLIDKKEAYTYYAAIDDSLSETDIERIKKDLKDNGYSGQTFEEFSSQFNTLISGIQYGLMGFSFIVLFVSVFGIVNTLLMSVYERTREIGLMKALGMKNSKVFQLFAIESSIIGLWGSILGIIAATALGYFFNIILDELLPDSLAGFDPYSFPTEQIPFVIIGIVLVAFISGTLPALKAARLDPITALRYE